MLWVDQGMSLGCVFLFCVPGAHVCVVVATICRCCSGLNRMQVYVIGINKGDDYRNKKATALAQNESDCDEHPAYGHNSFLCLLPSIVVLRLNILRRSPLERFWMHQQSYCRCLPMLGRFLRWAQTTPRMPRRPLGATPPSHPPCPPAPDRLRETTPQRPCRGRGIAPP